MADRLRRGRPSLRCRASLVSAHIRGSPSPARELAVEPQAEMIRILREEQLLAQEDQQQSRDDMTRILETVREMVVVVARMEKRPVEAETPAVTSEPGYVLPLPLLSAQFPHIPTAQPTLGGYEMPTPLMPVGVPLPR